MGQGGYILSGLPAGLAGEFRVSVSRSVIATVGQFL